MRVFHYTAALYPTTFGFVAVLLDDPSFQSVGRDLESALEHLSERMRHELKQHPWLPGPEVEEFEVATVPVEVRPEYRVERQVTPLEEVYRFRFPCAVGETDSGLNMCVVPSLAIQFYFEAGRNLRELVGHYVQECVKGLTPLQLLRHQPPSHIELRPCRVKRTRSLRDLANPRWPNLEAVAEPAHLSRIRGYGRELQLKNLKSNLQAGLSVAVVGKASVGKSSLIVEVARNLKNLWRTSAARLVAGMKYLGMWEERCQKVIEELGQASGILAVDNLTELMRQGGSEPGASLAAFMMPYVLDGQLQMVVEASPSEWLAARRVLPAFTELFRVLPLEPMNAVETLEVLAQVRTSLRIEANLDSSLLALFSKFSPYECLPGSAVRFLRRLHASDKKGPWNPARVIEAFSLQKGIPEEFLRDDIPVNAEDWATQLSNRVLGQPEAIQTALRILSALKSGLNDPQRPLGVYLLCGPTGVGKTELARCLAELLFGDEKRLIRLDMSEYSAPRSGQRLLGSLYDSTPATWLRELRQNPFAVLLLDEVEKAHPEVFDLFLRAFDEGQLCDPWGRVTSLKMSVTLMTSNLGAESMQTLGLRQNKKPSYDRAIHQFFRPELINRLDGVVGFSPLSPQVIRGVAIREVGLLQRRPGLRRRGLVLQPSSECLDYLVQHGHDPQLGARPLQRLLERKLIPRLTEWLRAHPDIQGETIRVRLVGSEFKLSLA